MGSCFRALAAPCGHVLAVGGCWAARLRSIPACCGSGRHWPLEMPLDGAPSPRVTFPLQNHHAGICPIGERDQGWDLEGPEHQQKWDVLSTRPKLSRPRQLQAGARPHLSSSLCNSPQVHGEAGGRRADLHACIATQREGEAMQNASQPPGNGLRSKKLQEPLCSFERAVVPVLPNTRDSCPKPPAQTCEAGLAGALRLLPLSAGMAKTPAKEGRKEKPLLGSFFFFSSPFFPLFP